MDIDAIVKDFITATFLAGKKSTPFTEEMSLVDSGLIDSLGIMKLLAFIEKRFGFIVPEDEVLPEHFESVVSISSYIRKNIPQR